MLGKQGVFLFKGAYKILQYTVSEPKAVFIESRQSNGGASVEDK